MPSAMDEATATLREMSLCGLLSAMLQNGSGN